MKKRWIVLSNFKTLTLEGHDVEEVTGCALQNKCHETPLQHFYKHFLHLTKQNKITKTKKIHIYKINQQKE